MNFQDARNNMEQDTPITGRVESVSGKEFNRKGNPLQKIGINDGEQVEKATVYIGRGEPMPSSLIGTEQSFTLKAKSGKGTIYFSGFWNNPNPTHANFTPKSTPKAKNYDNAAQSTQKADGSHDRNRSVCLAYAKDMVVGGVLAIDSMYTEAEKMVDFVENPPAKESEAGDDLPF